MMDSEPRQRVDKRLIVVDTEADDLFSVGKAVLTTLDTNISNFMRAN